MSPKTGIDWLDAELNRDAPQRSDPTLRPDVRYALASGFELDETLWMLDISDRQPRGDAAKEISEADRLDHVVRR